MQTPTRLITLVLMAAVVTGSPVTRARAKQQSSSGPAAAPLGKIQWQFNTNG